MRRHYSAVDFVPDGMSLVPVLMDRDKRSYYLFDFVPKATGVAYWLEPYDPTHNGIQFFARSWRELMDRKHLHPVDWEDPKYPVAHVERFIADMLRPEAVGLRRHLKALRRRLVS